MNIFYDTEFLEDGKTIDLISIGLVREDGKELYLLNKDMDTENAFADDWVRENVLKGIFDEMEDIYLSDYEGNPPFDFNEPNFWYFLNRYGNTKKEIGEKIVEFVGKKPIFFADTCAYDHVVLCQLFGKMINIPKGWRYYTRDIRQTIDELNFDTSKIHNLDEHNALSDAKHCFAIWKELEKIKTKS
jgi:hypothetical protein